MRLLATVDTAVNMGRITYVEGAEAVEVGGATSVGGDRAEEGIQSLS